MTKKEMPPKSMLFKLKEWLTLKDTAQYLSVLFKEDVSEADVLRLGLDGCLKLSVNFVNLSFAKCGKAVSCEDAEWYTPEEISDQTFYKEGEKVMKSLRIDGQRFLNLGNKIRPITGVWDLIMIDNVFSYIENKYQKLTGGPEVNISPYGSVFFEKNNLVYQLRKHHEGENKGGIYRNSCRAEVLPSDSVLVVRTQALMDLQESLSSEESTKGTLSGASYLDTRHDFYAKELRIAVEAWTELYEKNPPQHVPQGGHIKYITKWLEENYPKLANRAKERIATLINPNPKGGASPIGDN